VLSTSNVSAPFLDVFGFGAVTPRGVGIAYSLSDNDITVSVSSFTSQASALRTAIVVRACTRC
jgi:hypothetical protein